MRYLTSLSFALLGLALCRSALALPPDLVIQEGRFPSSPKLKGATRASSSELDAAARSIIAEQHSAASPAALGESRTSQLRNGERIVRVQQVHQGLPVASSGSAVVFGADDVARLVALRLVSDLPSDTTPSVSAEEAALFASFAVGREVDAARANLAIWPGPSGSRLAWVMSPEPAMNLAFAPVVVVDAMNGKLLLRFNTAKEAVGNVFATNPVKSPGPIQIPLPVTGDGTLLENELVATASCIDHKTIKQFGSTKVHVCDVEQTAIADKNGNFLYSPGKDTDPEDKFAEVSMFYHTNIIYKKFHSFDPGFQVQAGPLPAIANLRLAQGYPVAPGAAPDLEKMANPDLPLAPFMNAFFTPYDPAHEILAMLGLGAGAILFGQGPTIDFAYDGDVVYHEFTHAAVAATLKLVSHPRVDEQGTSYAPSAMNEALADYFSSAITGDPEVGEYAAPDINPGFPYVRTLENTDTCPASLGGEEHQDSTVFSGALWDVRKKLDPAKAKALDLAVFTAMNSSATGDLSYGGFATLIVKSVSASPLGKPVADALTASFTGRGVLPECLRVLEIKGEAPKGPLLNGWSAPGRLLTNTGDIAPGVLQFHSPLPESAKTVIISFGARDFAPKLLVKFGSEPITFDYKPLAVGDVKVLDPAQDGATFTATLDVPAGEESVYFMIANAADTSGLYGKIDVKTSPSESPAPGASSGGGASMEKPSPEPMSDFSCTASGAPSSTGYASLAAVMAGAWLSLSRRRPARRASARMYRS
jgi:hypothetical protein